MVVGGEVFQAGQWSQRAIDRLAQDGLLPTPRNYAVYYHYYSARNAALNASFEAITAYGKMTQENCDALYEQHIVTDSQMSFFKDANSRIDAELKKVMDMLASASKGTNQFGENLDNFSGTLSHADSLEVMRNAIEKIADETRVISAQNQQLQENLTATSTQLSDMRENFDRAYREAQVDPLTEVGNRKFFDREIIRVLTEATELKTPLCLLMVDIDHFKKFNDTHGHLIGDQVLRLVARTLVENLKGRDVIARYGGEEFVIVLPQTRLQDAERVANHLRNSLATKQITKRGTQEKLGVVTVSIGAAEYAVDEDSDTLISHADRALYKAKQTGRNKVVCDGIITGNA